MAAQRTGQDAARGIPLTYLGRLGRASQDAGPPRPGARVVPGLVEPPVPALGLLR